VPLDSYVSSSSSVSKYVRAASTTGPTRSPGVMPRETVSDRSPPSRPQPRKRPGGSGRPGSPGPGVPEHRRPVTLLHARVLRDHVQEPFTRRGRALTIKRRFHPMLGHILTSPIIGGGGSAPDTRWTGTHIPPLGFLYGRSTYRGDLPRCTGSPVHPVTGAVLPLSVPCHRAIKVRAAYPYRRLGLGPCKHGHIL
jgi:hypothetical protein